jgi:Tol biopolymer transport system component
MADRVRVAIRSIGKPESALSGIFISYRRSDNPDATGRLYDRLVGEFGKATVFKDVDSIPLGQDFRGHLNSIVGNCAVVLAIIGPRWIDARNEAGHRRLEDPDDFVRIELEAALSRDIPVVPVLVGHAAIPVASQLPETLAAMAFRQSIEVRPDPDFHNDATRLVTALHAILDPTAAAAKSSSSVNTRRAAATATQSARWLGWIVAAVLGLAVVALAVPAIRHLREPPAAGTPLVNLIMDVAPAAKLGPTLFFDRPSRTAIAISPDGATVVFSGETKAPDGTATQMLYRRPLAETQAVALPGTEGAEYPFFSPDGQWVGFAAGKKLKKVALSGGPPIDLCELTVSDPIGGASWGSAGGIAFADDGLWTVSDSGGKRQNLLKNDPGTELSTPAILPDGQTLLFTVYPGAGRWDAAHVDAINLTTKKRATLLTNASDARYSATGHLVFMRNASLLAVPFDATRAEIIGAPVPLLAGIMQSTNAPDTGGETGMGQFALSASGTLIYAAGDRYPTSASTLVRVDPKGAETKLAEIKGRFLAPRLSPSGSRVVGFRYGDGSKASDIWMYEIPSGSATRLTSTGDAAWPLFSPDGTGITFVTLTGDPEEYSLPLNGGNAPQRLIELKPGILASSWSADGKWLAYLQAVGSVEQIFVRPVRDSKLDSGAPRQFSPSTFDQSEAEFSPDGRWLAYTSNESGAEEVYVLPFPGPGEKHRISSTGGVNPAWSHDGRQLFYLRRNRAASRSMMTVDVSTTGEFKAGAPRVLFEGPYQSSVPVRSFDVTPDGQFIMVRTQDPPDQPVTRVNVVLGWAEELKRRVPVH